MFSRNSRRFIAAEPDAISVTDLALHRVTRIPIAGARAVAGFDDQLWIATADHQLVRVDWSGVPLGTPVSLPFATRTILEPAPCGPAAAVWSSMPAIGAIDDFGQLVAAQLADADVTIPLTGRRFVVARGAKLTLPSGQITALPPGTTVLAGAVASDGKTVMLLVPHTGGRQLIIVSLGTGQIIQRYALPTANIKLATRRGLAAVLVDPSLLRVLDLRAGRELGTARLDCEVDDFAIDPEGRGLALRSNSRSIELCMLPALLCKPATVEVAPVSDAASPALVTSSTTAPDLVESATQTSELPPHAPFTCATLTALDPLPPRAAIDRGVAIRQLDRELRSIVLWTLGAISRAWDSRKLGYGNEGKHPYELEVAAILGTSHGFASDYLTAARELLAEHEQSIASDPLWRAPDTPLGTLIAELSLEPIAVDIVLVVAAATLWGDIARLYGILANDTARAIIDELLVQEVLAHRHDRHAIAAALDPCAMLVRLGIVWVGRRTRPFSELSVDPVIVDRLRAVTPDLGRATAIRTTEHELAALDIPRPTLEAAVAVLARAPRGAVRIVVRGRIGTGRRTLVAALARHAGRALAVIDAQALPPSAAAFIAELGHALRRAQLAGLVPCIVNLSEVTFDEHAARELAIEALRLHPGPLAVVAAPDEPAPFGPGHIAIELPILGEIERRDIWARALAEDRIEARDLDAIAARYRIGPGLIRQATAATKDTGTADATAAIDAFVRQTRDARLGQYAHRVERLASWSSVVLPPEILDSLRELVARVRYGHQVFEIWGMGEKMMTSRGLTALFSGPPGTGKTLVAGVIARELGLDLYRVDLSKVMSKWIGETERNLATIFDAAEDGQVVLLFDEADSLFARRTEVRSSNDRYANLEVNYLLQRLDTFTGIAILTTNSGTSIDQAFKRRMSFRLSFPFPDEETREHLWRAHLPPSLPVTGPLELDALARKYQIAGGYIRNACLRAAFLAAQSETSLQQHHLERAVALEYAELGKLSNSGSLD